MGGTVEVVRGRGDGAGRARATGCGTVAVAKAEVLDKAREGHVEKGIGCVVVELVVERKMATAVGKISDKEVGWRGKCPTGPSQTTEKSALG